MAKKMDRNLIIVCSVVGSLGALSAILGFSAEGTKLTPYTILVLGDDCIYPQNPALGLGICAVIFLVAAQITISAVGGCCGCCRSRSIPSESKRIVGVICAVASWIAAVIAWALLIVGASWNANVVRVDAPFCPYLKDGIFAGGGVLALAATALGITSFILLRRQPAAPVEAAATPAASSVGGTPSRPDGQSPSSDVVIGRPLLPPPSKAQLPPKPQAYYVQEVPLPPSHPQENGQAPHNLPALPPPPAAGAQDNGSHGPNQQFFAPQGLPAAAAAVAGAPPSEPGEQPPPPTAAAVGVPMVQTQVSLPQVHMPNGVPQYSIPIPAPQVLGGEIPAPLPPTAPQAGNGLSSVIRNELTRATIRFAEKAMEHAVFSNNAATSTDMLSMVTDPSGGDVGGTDYRDATA